MSDTTLMQEQATRIAFLVEQEARLREEIATLRAELAQRDEWTPSTMFVYEYPDGKRGLVYAALDAYGRAQLRYVVDTGKEEADETIIIFPEHLRIWENKAKDSDQ